MANETVNFDEAVRRTLNYRRAEIKLDRLQACFACIKWVFIVTALVKSPTMETALLVMAAVGVTLARSHALREMERRRLNVMELLVKEGAISARDIVLSGFGDHWEAMLFKTARYIYFGFLIEALLVFAALAQVSHQYVWVGCAVIVSATLFTIVVRRFKRLLGDFAIEKFKAV
ncbi:MAG TPA: hypothetical protein VEA59_04090 [Patescibacteria group bacterium]|nr:hypothetical protein [Patescibacteria group bacterium]